ncbi:4-(cytidine 5'-diphospho)-2-C-methyl-D-erythritol kinase [Sphingobacterium griseoflavum]|uniref:4-diphosphocytidyl-2-C-methyl-D-erythritol kinase n=1 Tax=Sphingobacterium griseoflavum TaxID=1474952 RepID=A0ABQ3HTN6_9SPHI|nr:4-(cytidine 5'-diphospho)-2-C-methyl-D-erythritol kinase [Sphingobacterium griseoflavum]GHE33542.1 4-diphosphocytidyl-2-C-methyl-D-erythritol kinase [Sphingobacterium griseoflavum]
MISYANAKINLGLQVTSKREDGYHELETIFYPFPLYDIIEISRGDADKTTMKITGMDLELDENNLCYRAYNLLANTFELPPVHIHLHKQIPFGAGLGGGSSDAAAVLKMLNDNFLLGLTAEELASFAATLGADCPFFVYGTTMYATGIGTKLTPLNLDLSSYYMVLLKPDVHVSTASAYASIKPQPREFDIRELVSLPVQDWKFYLRNDFEEGIFANHPQIKRCKLAMYEHGALYASMSGSGSAVYGIFDRKVDLSVLADLGKIYYPVIF